METLACPEFRGVAWLDFRRPESSPVGADGRPPRTRPAGCRRRSNGAGGCSRSGPSPRREFHVGDRAPGIPAVDQLGLVQAVDRLGQGMSPWPSSRQLLLRRNGPFVPTACTTARKVGASSQLRVSPFTNGTWPANASTKGTPRAENHTGGPDDVRRIRRDTPSRAARAGRISLGRGLRAASRQAERPPKARAEYDRHGTGITLPLVAPVSHLSRGYDVRDVPTEREYVVTVDAIATGATFTPARLVGRAGPCHGLGDRPGGLRLLSSERQSGAFGRAWHANSVGVPFRQPIRNPDS